MINAQLRTMMKRRSNRSFAQLIIPGGDLLPAQRRTRLPTKLNNDNNNNECNRTLIVGPSICGKTHLSLNKLQLIRLSDSEKQIKIITRSPGQYSHTEIEDIVVEEDLSDKSIQDFQKCCVVFDDMLDSNQKLIDPFFSRGRQ